jgi:hypothetical protein
MLARIVVGADGAGAGNVSSTAFKTPQAEPTRMAMPSVECCGAAAWRIGIQPLRASPSRIPLCWFAADPGRAALVTGIRHRPRRAVPCCDVSLSIAHPLRPSLVTFCPSSRFPPCCVPAASLENSSALG